MIWTQGLKGGSVSLGLSCSAPGPGALFGSGPTCFPDLWEYQLSCSIKIIVTNRLVILWLQGVNLTLKPGAKVALVGPSGGGKVWLLNWLWLHMETWHTNKFRYCVFSTYMKFSHFGIWVWNCLAPLVCRLQLQTWWRDSMTLIEVWSPSMGSHWKTSTIVTFMRRYGCSRWGFFFKFDIYLTTLHETHDWLICC